MTNAAVREAGEDRAHITAVRRNPTVCVGRKAIDAHAAALNR